MSVKTMNLVRNCGTPKWKGLNLLLRKEGCLGKSLQP